MLKTLSLLSLLIVSTVTAANKPNIIFIFADDLSYEAVGISGRTEVKTPHIDSIAKNGANFLRSYNMGAWNGAVCMASRAMLNSGAFVNRAQNAIKKKPHWSQLMKQAGYKTYMTGKWHVAGKPRFDVVKDARPGMPKQTPSGYNRPKSPEDYQKGWKPWDKSKGGYWEGGTHWSEIVADQSVDFIKQAAKEDKPFFMYLAFNAPHDARQAPKEYIDMYPLDSLSVPKNFLSEYPYKDAIGCSASLRDEKLAPFPRSHYAVKVHRQEYFAITTHMDDQIGRILKALKASGKADNTYVIFTSDHGLAVGHHGLIGKQNMYDHSMRVPFFISGPGIKKGTRNSQAIYLQDAMATSLDIAGIKKPAHVEFQSVLPLLKGKKTQLKSIFGKYIDDQRMIQKGKWKLIIYPKASKKFRLFNMAKDTEEMNDLADNPEYAKILEKLKSEFVDLQKEMDDKLKINK